MHTADAWLWQELGHRQVLLVLHAVPSTGCALGQSAQSEVCCWSHLPSSRQISVWMFTAKRGQVVAYRTFLRTLMHELGHYLDYALLRLEESFHTTGFFRRESFLVKTLFPQEPGVK